MRLLFKYGRLGSGHLPVILAIVFSATLGATYCVSVFRGDVDPVFPYISTSGDTRPESCVFSLLLNICAFLSMIVIFLRYSLVVELNRSSDSLLKTVNRISYYFGLIGFFGMLIVANFQETAFILIHLTGALSCFGFGTLYMIGQAWITLRMHPMFCNRHIGYIRLALTVTSVICFLLSFGFGLLASYTFHKHYPNLPTPRPWNHKGLTPMPGYTFHCISAIAEWTLAILQISFFLSYSREFEKICVELSVQSLVTHLDHSPIISDGEDDSP